jgi:hypothetical protein
MRVSQALGADHSCLDECYEHLKSASTEDEKIKWRNMLTWNLARHAISEELTVYPAMEKHLGEEGKALTKKDFAQHQAVFPPSFPSRRRLMVLTDVDRLKMTFVF